MKNKILLSFIAISSLASASMNTETFLEDTFQNNFECKENICASENILAKENNTSATIDNLKFTFNKNVNEIQFIFDKDELRKMANDECEKKQMQTAGFRVDTFNKLKSDKLKELFVEIKEINLKNLIVEKDLEKSKVGEFNLKMDRKISNIKNNLDNLSINDLIGELNLELKDIETTKTKDFLMSIISILPKSETVIYDKMTGQPKIETDDNIKSINDKIYLMYKKISEKIDTSMSKGDASLSLKTESDALDLLINLNIKVKDSIVGENEFSLKLKLLQAIQTIKDSVAMQKNPMFLISVLGNNVIFDNLVFENKQNYLLTVHNDLLKSDKEYNKINNDLVSELNERESQLKLQDIFLYKILSLNNTSSSIKILNKKGMPIMSMLSVIENKEFVDIITEYK